MNLLAALREGGQVRAVDLALADTLRRLDPSTPDSVLAAAALASFAVAQGHAALDLAGARELAGIEPPPRDQWLAALRASRWVAQGEAGVESDPGSPLVLEHDLLYLRRYREYERRLALALQRLAAQDDEDGSLPDGLFARLFPDAGTGDAQADAARLALSRKLALITGGPGTGKTTTIARVLLLLLAQAREAGQPSPRIALAAPTGRAAERMAESLRHATAQLRGQPGIDDAPGSGPGQALLDDLPQQASTLHRLLGPLPDGTRFRHDRAHPLPYDIVVVDEASMVDLPLMCKLLEAVPDGARLVLLGDPDQLPSVEAGDVLAAIAGAASDRHPEDGGPEPLRLTAEERKARDHRLRRSEEKNGGLRGHLVHLQRAYRQSEALDVAPLAEAVRRGDADAALALLRDGALSGVQFHDDAHDPLRAPLRDRLLPDWQALQACDDPAGALRLAARQRLLTVLRDGPQGATTMNARIETLLAGAQREPYFHGRLLLVTRNSHRQRLFNGDIGICLRDDAGGTVAWFADGNGGPGSSPGQAVRGFHPSTLPAHTGAFAMTVHKAQGSEFDTTWLLLPARPNRVLSRELLYTAITRARRELHVAGSEGVIRDALSRHASRWSGLGWRLGDKKSRR